MKGNSNGHYRKITPELRKRLSIARKGKAMGLKPWNKGFTKETNELVADITSRSGKTRKERGSQKGERHGKWGKKDPASSARIIKTMRSGKMYGGKEGTKPELKMKELLDQAGIQYLFQEPIAGYLVDFLLPESKTIIEVDGECWHKFSDGREKDRVRDTDLKRLGYKVIRFWAQNVFKMDIIEL